MAYEIWKPGVMEHHLSRWQTQDVASMRRGLFALAMVVERQAKINASHGSHQPGTKTPASPGSGPSRISSQLVQGLTHQTLKAGLEVRVGTAAGVIHTRPGRGGAADRLRGTRAVEASTLDVTAQNTEAVADHTPLAWSDRH